MNSNYEHEHWAYMEKEAEEEEEAGDMHAWIPFGRLFAVCLLCV